MLFDSAIVESVAGAIPPWLAVILLVLSFAGSIYVIGPAVLLGYLYGDREQTSTWLGIIIAAYALFVVLKPLTAIERPAAEPSLSAETLPFLLSLLYDLAIDFDTGSFPSGHVLATTVFWGLVVLDLNYSTVRRRLLAGVAVVSFVCFTRVALTVHYLGDVIGGFLLGLALLGVLVPIRRRVANPARTIFALAVIPALAGIGLGRPIDGGVLLGAIAIGYLVNERLDPDWRPPFPTRG